jgi:hypothetical protein
VEEADRSGIASVFAADTELEIRARSPPALACLVNGSAHARTIPMEWLSSAQARLSIRGGRVTGAWHVCSAFNLDAADFVRRLADLGGSAS